MKKRKILIASDSFKEACTSLEAGEAIKNGLLRRKVPAEIAVFSVGDGGEGTADALITALGYKRITAAVHDTHGDTIEAEFGLSHDGTSAVFDMASCSGIKFARRHGLDICNSSTEGVGELLRYLVGIGVREITVGLGGSGTSDGGIGALGALGARFFRENGKEITSRLCTSSLGEVKSCCLEHAKALLDGVKLTLIYDSAVPLLGPRGAVMLYSRQKGAGEDMLPKLEADMENFAVSCGYDSVKLDGAGAAGGLGFGLSLVGGELQKGAEYVLGRVGFTDALGESDVIITGEGKTDAQTATGKLPLAIANAAKKANSRAAVICLCGVNDAVDELYDGGITAVFQISDRPMSAEDSISHTLTLLEKTAFNLGGLIELM
ncbi:MAG: glycerate kinase [Eubacteriales bacterium]